MEGFKSLINYISNPTILFTAILVGFPFVFPPNDWFYNINKKLKIDKLWTKKGLFVMVAVTIVFFVFGLGDSDFRSIVLKPDNVPISGLIILLIFFTWLNPDFEQMRERFRPFLKRDFHPLLRRRESLVNYF